MPDQANDQMLSHKDEPVFSTDAPLLYPLLDLNRAIEVATIFRKQERDVFQTANLQQVLESARPGEDHALEIEAAELFGFTTHQSDVVCLTQLGKAVLVPAEASAARVDAFLNVPLFGHLYERYKDALLPNVKEMDFELARLGVPVNDREAVRVAFHRSAMFAGFFSVGAHKLVKPVLRASVLAAPRPVSQPALRIGGGTGASNPGGRSSAMPHPMVQALIGSLPAPGSVWSLDQRRKWLQSAAVNFDLLYQGTDVDAGSLRIAIDH